MWLAMDSDQSGVFENLCRLVWVNLRARVCAGGWGGRGGAFYCSVLVCACVRVFLSLSLGGSMHGRARVCVLCVFT